MERVHLGGPARRLGGQLGPAHGADDHALRFGRGALAQDGVAPLGAEARQEVGRGAVPRVSPVVLEVEARREAGLPQRLLLVLGVEEHVDSVEALFPGQGTGGRQEGGRGRPALLARRDQQAAPGDRGEGHGERELRVVRDSSLTRRGRPGPVA